MIPAIYTALNVSAVTDIATGGIHYRKAPQGTTDPYVVWFIVSDTPSNYQSETPDRSNFRIQVDCWSRSPASLIDLKDKVRAQLDTIAHQIVGRDGYDDETQLHRYSLDYSFWTQL